MKNTFIYLTLCIFFLAYRVDAQSLSVSCFSYENACGSTGPPNGFAIASVSSGNPPYTYQWSTGAVHVTSFTNDTLFGLDDGTYTVTVTDGTAASGTSSTNVDDNGATLDYWINFVTLPCQGASNGTLILSTYGNCMPSPYTFFLQNNTTGQSWGPHSLGCTVITPLCHGVDTFKNLPAGSYFATLTNGQGCTGTLAVNMPELSPPVLSASVTSSPSCGNTASGKIITHINWNDFTTASNSYSGGASGPIPVWNSLSVSLYASGGSLIANHNNYWDSVFANVSPGSYEIRIAAHDFYGVQCINTYPVSVGMNSIPSAAISHSGPLTFCSGGGVQLNAPNGANKTYQWKKGGVNIPGATLSSYLAAIGGTYKVTVTNTISGCSKTTSTGTVVTVNPAPSATITPQGPTTFCAGGSVVLKANTGTGLTYKWKKGSNFISGATLSNYTAATGGNYRVQVTNSNGCSKVSALVAVSVPCREGESVNVGEGESEFEMKVFPNPNSGEFTIKFSNKPISSIQIELTDEMGKVVKRFETDNEIVVIKESNLAKGVYCLTVRNNEELLIKKINIVK